MLLSLSLSLSRKNYDDEDMPVEKLQDAMNDYLVDVINDKGVKDLRDTREQVSFCSWAARCRVWW